MKGLVVFDSNFGNTKIIAEAIAKELGKDVKAVQVSDFKKEDLKNFDLIVVGSPINGWMPTEKMRDFLSSLQKDDLKNSKVTTFDTRINLFIHGDAAKKMAKMLEEAGAKIITPPQVFFVKGKEGPLADGEFEKAIEWAKSIRTKII